VEIHQSIDAALILSSRLLYIATLKFRQRVCGYVCLLAVCLQSAVATVVYNSRQRFRLYRSVISSAIHQLTPCDFRHATAPHPIPMQPISPIDAINVYNVYKKSLQTRLLFCQRLSQ